MEPENPSRPPADRGVTDHEVADPEAGRDDAAPGDPQQAGRLARMMSAARRAVTAAPGAAWAALKAAPSAAGRAATRTWNALPRALPLIPGAVVVYYAWATLTSASNPMWFDEAFMFLTGILPGGRQIVQLVPHEMTYSLATLFTMRLFGNSDVILRIWAVVPLLLSVAWLARWLHRRYGWLPSTVGAAIVAFSPLVLYWGIQARGYGMLVAGAVLVLTGADDYLKGQRLAGAAALALGGVLGFGNFPQFAIPLGVVVLVLLIARPHLPTLVSAGAVGAIFLAVYRPSVLISKITAAAEHPGIEVRYSDAIFGIRRFLLEGTLTGAGTLDELLPPDRIAPVVWGALTLIVVGVVWSWYRDGVARTLVRAVPVPLTFLALAAGDFSISDRNVLFLLPFLAVLAALGAHAVSTWASRWVASEVVAGVLMAGAVGWVVVKAVPMVVFWQLVPIEAYGPASGAALSFHSAVAFYDEDSDEGARIVTDSVRPAGFERYVGGQLEVLSTEGLLEVICDHPGPIAVLDHPYRLRDDRLYSDCLDERGATIQAFGQRRRGARMLVHLIDDRGLVDVAGLDGGDRDR